MTMITDIHIADWVVLARVGIHPHEHDMPQRVKVTIGARLAASRPVRDMADTVDYMGMAEAIRRLLTEHHTPLLEDAAAQIAHTLMADARLQSVQVRLDKLEVLETGAVGVSVTLMRQEL